MSTTSNFNTVRVLSESEFENNFSSTSNDTLYFVEMDNTMFDGQWVFSHLLIANATAISNNDVTSTINSYLPDRNHTYMILCKTNLSRNDSSGSNTQLDIYTLPFNQIFSRIQADGSNFQQSHDSFILLVRPDDSVYYRIQNYKVTSGASFEVLAYRRVGTNN